MYLCSSLFRFCDKNKSNEKGRIPSEEADLNFRDAKKFYRTPIVFIPKHKRFNNTQHDETEHNDENPGKYNAMFERRAGKGQCFNQPYLGTREFSASFRLIDENMPMPEAIKENRDLGIMLYDLDFEKNLNTPDSMFYHAKMNKGVIIVPPKDSEEILR